MRSVTDSILKRQCGEVFSKQQHDYTKTLVAATPRADVYQASRTKKPAGWAIMLTLPSNRDRSPLGATPQPYASIAYPKNRGTKKAHRYMYYNTWLDSAYVGAFLAMEIKKRFGFAVREHRRLFKVSQEELAMRIGADQAYVSRIEAGQMNVTLETVEQIASALGADASDLFKPNDVRDINR
jgi:DNA-binding XRE family transcriptional regulator